MKLVKETYFPGTVVMNKFAKIWQNRVISKRMKIGLVKYPTISFILYTLQMQEQIVLVVSRCIDAPNSISTTELRTTAFSKKLNPAPLLPIQRKKFSNYCGYVKQGSKEFAETYLAK